MNLLVSTYAALRAADEGRLHRDEEGWYVQGRTRAFARTDLRKATVAELAGLIDEQAPHALTEAGREALGNPQ